jgi:hypothetical protein
VELAVSCWNKPFVEQLKTSQSYIYLSETMIITQLVKTFPAFNKREYVTVLKMPHTEPVQSLPRPKNLIFLTLVLTPHSIPNLCVPSAIIGFLGYKLETVTS